MSSRKRAGLNAVPQQSPIQPGLSYPPNHDSGGISSDNYVNWDETAGTSNINNAFDDTNTFDPSYYFGDVNGSAARETGSGLGAGQSQYSGQLVKRNNNQHLATRPNNWQEFSGPGRRNQSGVWENEEDDDEDLEAKALVARKEAQSNGKQKQMPPFVQKLSRYVITNLYSNVQNLTSIVSWTKRETRT